MRTCKKCGESDFYKCGACKRCAKERAAKYRLNNPEKVKQAINNWIENNPEKAKENKKKWKRNNKERISFLNKENRKRNLEKFRSNAKNYREQNKQKVKTYQTRYACKNKEKILYRGREWKKKNKELVRIYSLNRLSKKRSSGTLSKNLVKKLYDIQKGRCACCGEKLGDDYHLDHIMPLFLGGTNEDSNMQLLKSSCNLKKSKKHPIDYMQSKGYLL